MSRNNTFPVLAMILSAFALVALLQKGITGFVINKDFGSVLINTTLSAMGPLIVLAAILTIAVVALHKTTKSK